MISQIIRLIVFIDQLQVIYISVNYDRCTSIITDNGDIKSDSEVTTLDITTWNQHVINQILSIEKCLIIKYLVSVLSKFKDMDYKNIKLKF